MAANNLYSLYPEKYCTHFNDIRINYYIYGVNEFNERIILDLRFTLFALICIKSKWPSMFGTTDILRTTIPM